MAASVMAMRLIFDNLSIVLSIYGIGELRLNKTSTSDAGCKTDKVGSDKWVKSLDIIVANVFIRLSLFPLTGLE